MKVLDNSAFKIKNVITVLPVQYFYQHTSIFFLDVNKQLKHNCSMYFYNGRSYERVVFFIRIVYVTLTMCCNVQKHCPLTCYVIVMLSIIYLWEMQCARK